MDTFNIHNQCILYEVQKMIGILLNLILRIFLVKLFLRIEIQIQKKQPPKTKVYSFFHRYLLLTTPSHVSTITSFRSTITSFRSTITSFRSTITSFRSTITSFRSTMQSFRSTMQSFRSTMQSFRSMTTSFRSTITSLGSTITSLGRNNGMFLRTSLNTNTMYSQFIKHEKYWDWQKTLN